MDNETKYTLRVVCGGDMTGAHVYATRQSIYARQELNFVVGQCVAADGDTRIYDMTPMEEGAE